MQLQPLNLNVFAELCELTTPSACEFMSAKRVGWVNDYRKHIGQLFRSDTEL